MKRLLTPLLSLPAKIMLCTGTMVLVFLICHMLDTGSLPCDLFGK